MIDLAICETDRPCQVQIDDRCNHTDVCSSVGSNHSPTYLDGEWGQEMSGEGTTRRRGENLRIGGHAKPLLVSEMLEVGVRRDGLWRPRILLPSTAGLSVMGVGVIMWLVFGGFRKPSPIYHDSQRKRETSRRPSRNSRKITRTSIQHQSFVRLAFAGATR